MRKQFVKQLLLMQDLPSKKHSHHVCKVCLPRNSRKKNLEGEESEDEVSDEVEEGSYSEEDEEIAVEDDEVEVADEAPVEEPAAEEAPAEEAPVEEPAAEEAPADEEEARCRRRS